MDESTQVKFIYRENLNRFKDEFLLACENKRNFHKNIKDKIAENKNQDVKIIINNTEYK